MAKLKKSNRSISIRLSINITLDDVGLQPLFKELQLIEDEASGLEARQIHALKRRHLLKILHTYCSKSTGNGQHVPQHVKVVDQVANQVQSQDTGKNIVTQPLKNIDPLPKAAPLTPKKDNLPSLTSNTDAINEAIVSGMGDDFGFN